MLSIMGRYWRRRLAEDLDLSPASTWYDIEHELFARKLLEGDLRNRLRIAERDRGEMAAFLQTAAYWWWERGRAGAPPPAPPAAPPAA